jgi:hypothetical protein
MLSVIYKFHNSANDSSRMDDAAPCNITGDANKVHVNLIEFLTGDNADDKVLKEPWQETVRRM